MNLALWKKAWGEVRLTLPAFVLLMFGFQVLHSWVASQLDLRLVEHVLRAMPEFLQRVLPVSIESLSSYQGRLAIGYDHPLVAIGCAFWAVSRGSDTVSGPLNRGTLEMVLAQPVRRVEVLAASAAFAVIGAALMALACWLGTLLSVASFAKLQGIDGRQFGYCALNLFAYTFFLAGLATLVSSADRYRSRTIGIMAGLYVMAILLKLLGRMADGYQLALYTSFLTPYEPQRFVDPQYDPAALAISYNVPLFALGLLSFIAASIIFTRRDLPAPL
jgi:ABC-2 type transport system permease protein